MAPFVAKLQPNQVSGRCCEKAVCCNRTLRHSSVCKRTDKALCCNSEYNEQVGVEELTKHFVAILRKLHVIYSILSSKTLDTVAVNVEGGVVSSCIYTGPYRQAC